VAIDDLLDASNTSNTGRTVSLPFTEDRVIARVRKFSDNSYFLFKIIVNNIKIKKLKGYNIYSIVRVHISKPFMET
jgi:hypothetical protein